MKKNIFSLIAFIMIFSLINHILSIQVKAAEKTSSTFVESYNEIYYFETVIENSTDKNALAPYANANYVTKTKTTRIKNEDNKVLWSVSIKATFYYDGTTSKCISHTPSATSHISTWSIKNITSSMNGNSATAKAIAKRTLSSGTTYDVTKSVTIKCSPTGVVS